MAVRLPSIGLARAPKVKVVKPQKVNVAQTMGKSALPNLNSLLQGVGKPMAVKKINVRNKGFG